MVMALDKMPALSDYGAIIAQFLPFVVLIVVFYFFLIRPQRKRDKQERDMRNSIEVGDEISTIGGFIGRVVSIKDDVLVSDRDGRGAQGSKEGRKVITPFLAE